MCLDRVDEFIKCPVDRIGYKIVKKVGFGTNDSVHYHSWDHLQAAGFEYILGEWVDDPVPPKTKIKHSYHSYAAGFHCFTDFKKILLWCRNNLEDDMLLQMYTSSGGTLALIKVEYNDVVASGTDYGNINVVVARKLKNLGEVDWKTECQKLT
jgi:hypothetical protein